MKPWLTYCGYFLYFLTSIGLAIIMFILIFHEFLKW